MWKEVIIGQGNRCTYRNTSQVQRKQQLTPGSKEGTFSAGFLRVNRSLPIGQKGKEIVMIACLLPSLATHCTSRCFANYALPLGVSITPALSVLFQWPEMFFPSFP